MNVQGLVALTSDADFHVTLQRIEDELAARAIKPSARIDHADAAGQAGLALAPTILLIFGNPALGTPLMQKRQTLGIDLPLKMLIWNDQGGVYVGYNDPIWIAERHGLGAEAHELRTMADTLAALAGVAAGKHM